MLGQGETGAFPRPGDRPCRISQHTHAKRLGLLSLLPTPNTPATSLHHSGEVPMLSWPSNDGRGEGLFLQRALQVGVGMG